MPYAVSLELVRQYDHWNNGAPIATFAWSIAQWYDLATLARLADAGPWQVRRAAIASLGVLADDGWSGVVGQALSDPVRSVRLAAETAIGRLWTKILPISYRLRLRATMRQVDLDPRGALKELESWERIATRHAIVWQLRGRALEHLGYPEEASECHRIAWQIDPFRYPALHDHARILEHQGRPEAALRLYRRALEVFPDLPQVHGRVRQLGQRSP